MKLFAVLLVTCACAAFGAAPESAVIGVWRAQIDGVTALVMTISDEGGPLAGAILFYLVRRDEGQPPRSAPGIPEPLFNMKFDGKALDFRVSHRRSHGARTANDPPVGFRLRITGPNRGVLVRENGPDSALPVTRDH